MRDGREGPSSSSCDLWQLPVITVAELFSVVRFSAGKRGGFGCVVGIDHGQQRETLRQHGADVVIKSLREVHVEQS